MKNFKLSKSAIILSLALISHTEILAMDESFFDHFQAYSISKLHQKGITGSGYKVGIVEGGASPVHPALVGKIEVVDKKYDFKQNDAQIHGNHVSALIIGNKTDNFQGGVVPEAIGYVTSNRSIEDIESLMNNTQDVHIINCSGTLIPVRLNDKCSYDGLTAREKKALKDTLVNNDAVLVITGSNNHSYISRGGPLSYLMDLIDDPELAERVLIVSNLKYVSENELLKKEEFIKNWQDFIIPKLKEFNKENKTKKVTNLYNHLVKYVKNNSPELLDFCQNIQNIFQVHSHEDLREIFDRNDYQWEDEAKKMLNDRRFREYLNNNMDQETLTKNLITIADFLRKIALDFDLYRTKDQQFWELQNYIGGAFYYNNYQIWESFHQNGYLQRRFSYGWIDQDDFAKEINDLEKEIISDLSSIPQDKNQSGTTASVRAGEAKDHVITAYGTDILSAWTNQGYSKQTGSSMAAPITTGILVLLHEYCNQYLSQPTSWVDIIRIVKKSVRPIGDPSVFGLGILDTNRLFNQFFVPPTCCGLTL